MPTTEPTGWQTVIAETSGREGRIETSSHVQRLQVPGGWLYKTVHTYRAVLFVTTTFVPDPQEDPNWG
jgi:hypothetical protein